jgi:hypothetical protein
MGARGRIYLNEARGIGRRIDIVTLGSNDAPKRGEASQPAKSRPLGRGKKKRGEEGGNPGRILGRL